MPSLLSLYQTLPYPLRVIAASARGYRLRQLRYGRGFQTALDLVLEREVWSAQQWSNWQQETLARLLHHAAANVPWYRQMWQERRRRGDNSSIEVLTNWPILEKEQLRQHSRALVAETANFRALQHTVTSGTTGTPAHLWTSNATLRIWYAQMETRMRLWHGITRHDAWAHLGGKQVSSIRSSRPPFWVWNQGLNQLYLSIYHMRPGRFALYASAIRRHGAQSLIGYSSALYELAKGCISEGVASLRLKTVLSDGEPVSSKQRAAIRQAFGCELRESYGMVEMAAAGSECEHGHLHQWPDTGIIETVDGDRALAAGVTGDFLCTGLLNHDMPLIRYRNGDRGAVSYCPSRCVCGRVLPEIERIEGRISDLLITADGRRLPPSYVECIFEEDHPIAEAQLVQRSLGVLTLRYVPLSEFDAGAERRLRHSITAIIGGGMKVDFEPMDRIPRGANGKLRAVVCELSHEERQVALAGLPAVT